MSVELKVKIKSLAEEARIIRKEEQKVHGLAKYNLQQHRKTVVRSEARHTLLAYGFLRGRDYRAMEKTCRIPPQPSRVVRMVARYGDSSEGVVAWLELPPIDTTTSLADIAS